MYSRLYQFTIDNTTAVWAYSIGLFLMDAMKYEFLYPLHYCHFVV